MKPSTSVSIPSSLQTTPATTADDTEHHILIASFVGVAVILVMILLFAIYCYNKRNPMQIRHNYNANRNTDVSDTVFNSSDIPTTYVNENKGLQHGDQDASELAHDISIKLKIHWDDMYSNMESEKFKTLRDQLVESMEDLYKQYCEFSGAILLKLRKGSVIADIRLKFSKLAVEPLNIIKNAVIQGKCSSFEVENDYFLLQERCSRRSRSDKTESGYGSQFFEHISFVEKSQEQKLTDNSDRLPESNSSADLKSASVVSVTKVTGIVHKGEVEGKVGKRVMEGRSSSCGVKLKKKDDTNKHVEDKKGLHHVARFDFSPQDYRELALHQGEFVHITCIDAGGWVKVVNGSGEQGWVPRNFIAEIDPEDYVNTKKAVESIIFLDQMIESADVPDDVTTEVANIQTDGIIEGAKVSSHVANNSYENIPSENVSGENGLFVAIFPFDPTDDKELKLEVGDFIDVSKTSETGWWKGCCVRTSSVGWFPSTYVKPKSAQINFKSFFGDLSHVDESVSDSEVHSSKRSPILNGYYSDNEENMAKENFMLRGSESENSMSFEYEDIDDKDGMKKHGLRTSSEVVHSSGSFSEVKQKTTTCVINERLVAFQTRVGGDVIVNPASEPPTKPVPPKPRKSHIRQTYQRLAAKGQLCSSNDLITRSLESLHVSSKSGNRRHSEEIFTPDNNCNKKEMFLAGPIEKDRPWSFQGAPRFLQLANRYASDMRSSWSLPSLNGDQIKLSPDDDRPYLDPIPRKNKTTSVEILDLPEIHSGDNVFTDEYVELNEHNISKKLKPTEAEQSKFTGKMISLVVRKENGVISPKIDETEMGSIDAPPKPKRDSLKYGFSVTITSNDEIKNQREISHSFESCCDKHLTTSSTRGKKDSTEECDCEMASRSNEPKVIDEGIASLKPCTRIRNSSNRNFASFECINEEGEQISITKKDVKEESMDDDIKTGVLHGSVCNNNSLTCMLNGDKKPSSFSHNQTASEYKLKNDLKYYINGNSHIDERHKLSSRKINSFGEEESEEESIVSRTSSTLSLSSFNSSNASSARSTTSSKHEQMNLRRAAMNVCGKGDQDLTFKIGAMLYELRPRNKKGLCFGLLEDSTQGWYPAESVEIFQEFFQERV